MRFKMAEMRVDVPSKACAPGRVLQLVPLLRHWGLLSPDAEGYRGCGGEASTVRRILRFFKIMHF